jgi:hypothetical protein
MQKHSGVAGDDVDLLYAITLIVAIAAGVLSLLASVLAIFGPFANADPRSRTWKVLVSHRLSDGALALGAFSLAISVAVHSHWGHGPGTVVPMEFERLISEHEAFPTVGAVLLLGLALTLYGKRRSRHGNAASGTKRS